MSEKTVGQPQVKLEDTTSFETPEGNKIFQQGVLLRSVSKFVGCKVVPTYVYARMYKNGGILKKHTDRPACEISVTLHLGGDTSWPIWIQTPEGDAVSVNLQEGDSMIYLGCIAPHWRNIYFGNTYAQVFLHYVRKNGIYASEENDSADDPYANANTKKLLEEYRQLL